MQLFVEFDESLKVPTIEKLLTKMFKEQRISFAEVKSLYYKFFPYIALQVPSKLLIRVPKYGREFQKRIIPGIKFHPSPLLDNPCNDEFVPSFATNSPHM